MLLSGQPRHVPARAIKLQPILTRQRRNKLLVRIRLRPAELVIEVNNRKDNAKVLPQHDKQPQKRNRIDAAGDSDGDAVAGLQQFIPADVKKQAMREGVHRNMVAQGWAGKAEVRSSSELEERRHPERPRFHQRGGACPEQVSEASASNGDLLRRECLLGEILRFG